MKLAVATCQFPVTADIRRNVGHVARQLREASDRGARLAHFPEAALSGYAGVNFPSHKGFDWALLAECTHEVLELAGRLGIWVVLGSAHRLTGEHKPHNSLYLIDDRGTLVDRYDKMFCAGDASASTDDLAHYSSGNHFSVVTIDGVRCNSLICHDNRYPELYREYRRRGVELVFHSFRAAGYGADRFAAMRSYTGVVSGRLRRHGTGVLVSEVDTELELYDSTGAWRERAMNGTFHSGPLVHDARSLARTAL